jgi:hypothetical protein
VYRLPAVNHGTAIPATPGAAGGQVSTEGPVNELAGGVKPGPLTTPSQLILSLAGVHPSSAVPGASTISSEQRRGQEIEGGERGADSGCVVVIAQGPA